MRKGYLKKNSFVKGKTCLRVFVRYLEGLERGENDLLIEDWQ